jgi:hypothetical protein
MSPFSHRNTNRCTYHIKLFLTITNVDPAHPLTPQPPTQPQSPRVSSCAAFSGTRILFVAEECSTWLQNTRSGLASAHFGDHRLLCIHKVSTSERVHACEPCHRPCHHYELFWAALACVAPTSVGVKPSKPFAYPRTLFCQSQGHPQVLQCDSLFEFLPPRDPQQRG